MGIRPVITFLSVVIISCTPTRNPGHRDLHTLNTVSWEVTRLDPAVTWRHSSFLTLFDTIENINILDIDLNDSGIHPTILYQDTLLSPTHEIAEKENALAAVNGNFFHMQRGGSVCYLKVGGRVIDTSQTNLGQKYFLDELDDAAFTIDAMGKVAILPCPPAGWQSLTHIPTILSGGPPLLIHNKAIPLINHSFNRNRYARTGVGITTRHHLLIVAIDGHSDKSRGVTIDEFRTLFQYLHCTDAMNLDGGGSTTMYIKGQPYNGIVNYPTDNKKYDHTGERKIANILAVIRK